MCKANNLQSDPCEITVHLLFPELLLCLKSLCLHSWSRRTFVSLDPDGKLKSNATSLFFIYFLCKCHAILDFGFLSHDPIFSFCAGFYGHSFHFICFVLLSCICSFNISSEVPLFSLGDLLLWSWSWSSLESVSWPWRSSSVDDL